VCGFNGNPVQCSAKVDLDWKMGDIKSGWKNAWVLPDMIYDLIVGTDWMAKFNPYIDFKNRAIIVKGQKCEMANVRYKLNEQVQGSEIPPERE